VRTLHGHTSRFAGTLCLLCAFGSAMPAGRAAAQLVLNDPNYAVIDLPSGVGAKGVECSPGGVWGNFVYIADSGAGTIDKLDFTDHMFPFASGLSFPVGMEFGPGPGNNFGTYLYVASNAGNAIQRVTPAGVVSTFATMTGPGDVAFDPTGGYGTSLFATTAYASPIQRFTSAAVGSTFSSLASLYLKFGPGGAWGTGLYATSNGFGSIGVGIAKVASNGTATLFAGGFSSPEGFDWGFGGDMFATDLTANQIWRINSAGTKTLFGTTQNPADITFCNGNLYVVCYNGACFKVIHLTAGVGDPAPASTPIRVQPAPSRGATTIVFAQPRPGFADVRILDLGGRLVREVSGAWRSAGAQRVTWDGLDAGGQHVPPGVYLAHVAAGGLSRSARIVIVN
jgi:flagellar hook capping protein FlgD